MGSVVGSGYAWVDYNNDGWIDLYATMRQGANFMYRNNGDGTFTEVAASLGLSDAEGDGAGVAAADYDNDGWTDIYISNADSDRLMKNINGNFFMDVTARAGLDANEMARGTSPSWGDYDQDGHLDLYVCNHIPVGGGSAFQRRDRFYYNNGDGTFTDVSYLIDEYSREAASFIVAWVDIDNDCDSDMIQITDCPVGSASVPVRIHRNNGGTDPLNWDFEEVSDAIGVSDCKNGMGIGVGDIDHNGYQDFFYSNIGPSTLYKNNGGVFSDATTPIIGNQEFYHWSWGTAIFDYDNDGWSDLMLAMANKFKRADTPSNDFLFRNNGDGSTFDDVSTAQNMDDLTRSHHCIYGDYDQDGDLDIFLGGYGDQSTLKRNDNDTGNNWIQIVLAGTTSNRQGIGAKIKISTPDGDSQYYQTRSGSNLGGGDQLGAHFGLGTNSIIDEIEITWPNGSCDKQYLYNVDVNQILGIIENIGPPSCTDGVQNGDETGVDCGGANCPPCPTCNDGIQNGDEEGVDCGGSFCTPCITCNDGIQNGDEEGVDCGGSFCAPCATCNDGIQNGDEEDVDCGGSFCAPCPDCPENTVTLILTLDSNGDQNTWELLDGVGNVIEAGGPYGGYPNGTQIIEEFCLPDGCYTFNIYDSVGNGLCCRFGSGSYFLYDGDGNLIAAGANTGFSDSIDFCFGNSNLSGAPSVVLGNADASLVTSLDVFPNPVQEGGQLNLDYNGKSESFDISVYDVNGKQLARFNTNQLDSYMELSDLGINNRGVYLIRVNDGVENFVNKILVQ
jgi:hypothetical protein